MHDHMPSVHELGSEQREPHIEKRSGGPITDMAGLEFGWRTIPSRIVLLFPIIRSQNQNTHPSGQLLCTIVTPPRLEQWDPRP